MGKLDVLWAYQEADMEVLRYENEMRRDPTRNKLLRLRNFVAEQQGEIQSCEARAQQARARIAEIEAIGSEGESFLEQRQADVDGMESASLEEVRSALKEAQKVLEGLRQGEQEVRAIIAQAEATEAKLRDIRQKVSQARTQYNQLKEGYDKTYAEQAKQLEELKGKRVCAAQGVDKQLLSRYESIKQQCTPPMAQLMGDQCGGCNMSLPAVVVKRVNDQQNLVECENCGRILYLK